MSKIISFISGTWSIPAHAPQACPSKFSALLMTLLLLLLLNN